MTVWLRRRNNMAKTYKHLYSRIASFENLHTAYLKARGNKRFKPDVLEFSANLETNLLALREKLLKKTYRTGEYYVFEVYEPKKRVVAALPFRDRVAHHALCNVIEPIWEARFIRDSYACRVGKGTHAGADRVTEFLRRAKQKWEQVYVLKLDVRAYFPSVDHIVLLDLLEKRIACKDTQWLIREIVESWPVGGGEKGIPIGNLTSQLFANIYLHEMDKFVKHELRARFFVRYMDDAVIIHANKAWLREAKLRLGEFLAERLALTLNTKTNIFPMAQGVNFLGYRIWATHRLLRKSSVKRMRRKLRHFEQGYTDGSVDLDHITASIMSWLGHTSHADCYNLRKRLFQDFKLRRSNDGNNESIAKPAGSSDCQQPRQSTSANPGGHIRHGDSGDECDY